MKVRDILLIICSAWNLSLNIVYLIIFTKIWIYGSDIVVENNIGIRTLETVWLIISIVLTIVLTIHIAFHIGEEK